MTMKTKEAMLYPHQIEALGKMRDGCILHGGVGSGKSRTALAYYYKSIGGNFDTWPKVDNIRKLYIITTAKKRDTLEWEGELIPFGIENAVIDSWNNIGKYTDVKNSFFIFDEQRVVGKGSWVKAFLKIARANRWILLSATPGDTWSDYIPVFIANGFYKNRSEFTRNHIIMKPFTKFPQIDRYVGEDRLMRLRDLILVDMDFIRPTKQHHEFIFTDYDKVEYKDIVRSRWNPWTGAPIETPGEYCQCLRKLVATDESRVNKLMVLLERHPKSIIFYNFDYERELLIDRCSYSGYEVAEWSGHKHQLVPESDKWVYLVQYNAGCEGWNCITTDTIIFYSENYSYKCMEQAAGRIDRMNTKFVNLWYYHMTSKSSIGLAIRRALNEKKRFNEERFANIEKR